MKAKRTKRTKTRKLSIRVKILIPALITNLLICILMGGMILARSKITLVNSGKEASLLLAQTAAQLVDSQQLAILNPGDEESDNYKNILQNLKKVKNNSKVVYLYSLKLEADGSLTYVMDCDENKETKLSIGDVCSETVPEMFEALKGKEAVTDIVSNQYGTQISAYVPITNEKGEVVGAIGSDYDASAIQANLNAIMKECVYKVLLALILSAVTMLLVSSRIRKGLRSVEEKIDDVVNSGGDLTKELKVTSGDELENISNGMNNFLKYIREILINISGSSDSLDLSSETIVKQVGAVSEIILEISDTMQQMSAAMEETSASVTQIDHSTEQIYESLSDVTKKATEGSEYADKIQKRAGIVKNQITSAEQQAKLLVVDIGGKLNEKIQQSKSVEKIKALTEEIIKITKQTNMLALNASIEAARAGEQGKGFAVVALQIGELAVNSGKTAAEIQEVSSMVIRAVEELSTESERMISFLNEEVLSDYDKMAMTGELYSVDSIEISKMMTEFMNGAHVLEEKMNEIKEALSAVSKAVEESAEGTVNVSNMTTNLMDNAEQIAQSTAENLDVTFKLNEEVNKFKI